VTRISERVLFPGIVSIVLWSEVLVPETEMLVFELGNIGTGIALTGLFLGWNIITS